MGLSCGRDVHRLLDTWLVSEERCDEESSKPVTSAAEKAESEELEVACLGLALEMMVILRA